MYFNLTAVMELSQLYWRYCSKSNGSNATERNCDRCKGAERNCDRCKLLLDASMDTLYFGVLYVLRSISFSPELHGGLHGRLKVDVKAGQC